MVDALRKSVLTGDAYEDRPTEGFRVKRQTMGDAPKNTDILFGALDLAASRIKDRIEELRSQGKSYEEIWLDAAKNGDREIVSYLLSKPPAGFDPNAHGENGRTALHEAVLRGDMELVRLISENSNVDIAASDDAGNSAYELAVAEDRVEVGNYLRGLLEAHMSEAYGEGDDIRMNALVAAGANDARPEASGIETLSSETRRPPGDNRTAQEIIATNQTLANLSIVDKEFLKNGYPENYARDTFGEDFEVTFTGVGDFENDADAAYRAALVIQHIENFDDNGNMITGNSVNDGKIDGWTADRTLARRPYQINPNSEAMPGTEAGRFQDFIKYGFSSLQGSFDVINAPKPGDGTNYDELIDKLDFRDDLTTEEVDGESLTVQQLAIRNLLKEYQEKIEKGEIKEKDADGNVDARWQFFYAMQAQGDLVNGRELQTHVEQQWYGGDTTRDLGEDTAFAWAADMNGIIDSEKVSQAIQDSLSDPTVAGDFNRSMLVAAGKVPGFNAELTIQNIEALTGSAGFQQYLSDLQKTDPDKAGAQTQRIVGAYGVLAGESASEALTAELVRSGLTQQLDDLLASPESIPEEYWLSATNDFITNALGAAIASGALTAHSLSILQDPKLKELLANKDFQKSFAEITKNYFRDLQEAGGRLTPEQLEKMSRDLAAAGDRAFGAEADKALAKEALATLAANGFLGSAVGFISLASGIRRMTNNEGFTDDPLQNLAMVNSFMVYLGTIDNQVAFADMAMRHTNIGRMLHFGNTADLFGATTLRDMYNVSPNNIWKDQIERALRQADANPPTIGGKPVSGDIIDSLARRFGGPDAPATDLKLRTAVAAIRVISAIANTGFGILATASGALGLTKADNPEDRAVAALNLAAGVAFTGAGVAQGASLLGLRAAAPFIARFNFAGIFLSSIGLVIAEILSEKKDNQIQVDYFTRLGGLGLVQEDGYDKLRFLELYGYDRNLPEVGYDKSRFETYDWQQWLEDYDRDNVGNYTGNPNIPELNYNSGAEDTLNAIVSIYGDRINVEDRTVPALKGELLEHMSNLIEFYFRNVDSNDDGEGAATWAIEQLRGRLGNVYEDSDDARAALDVLNGWLTRDHTSDSNGNPINGTERIAELANEIRSGLGLGPTDPDQDEQQPRTPSLTNGDGPMWDFN